jgi:hypothetical protein
MKANAVPLLNLFERKLQLEVPLFQRQYVWKQETQWGPLWEDISGKFREYIEGRKDAPIHFLGAMVLDQKQTPVAHVEKRQVIDGQQRLTTLQIFLSALRDFCRENGCHELAKELEGYTINKGMMANAATDQFKVWPTQGDREQYADAVSLGSRAAVESKHPLVVLKPKRTPEPRPLMIEAYLYFSNELRKFYFGTEDESPIAAEIPLPTRIEECFQALKSALQVVAIDLERDDDAQVIFETLNARGEPLLPSDLLRNYIFLRAGRNREPQDELYQKYWKGFEDAFWGVEVRQGRLTRSRSDLFMQYFLISRKAVEVVAKHLFVEYRHWIEHDTPFQSVAAELCSLAKQREEFRRLLEPKKGDHLAGLAQFLSDFEVGTVYPFLLFLFDSELSTADWQEVATTLESYFVRRTIMGWPTKGYSNMFLALIRAFRQNKPTAQAVAAHLAQLTGENLAWPTDAQFSEAWKALPAYSAFTPKVKLVHILRRIGETYSSKKNERIPIDRPLTVEHLMPQDWIEHWPLMDGTVGLTSDELQVTAETAERATATRRRNKALQTFGNLTILTLELNASVSNSAWKTKKSELLAASLLPMNSELHKYDVWNEDTIATRGEELLKRALAVWPRPVAPSAS